MENQTTISMILASAVIASVITSIFSIYISYLTNKNLRNVEILKNNNEIDTFRYTKLFELNTDLINLDLNINNPNYIEELLNKDTKVQNVFNKAKAILNKNYYDKITSAFQEVEIGYKKVADSVRAGIK